MRIPYFAENGEEAAVRFRIALEKSEEGEDRFRWRTGSKGSAAAVANQIANTQLRAVEVERRVREQDELEIRLDKLEGLLERAEERSRYGGR